MRVRMIAIVFLTLEAAGAAAWWGLLLALPEARAPFLARGAPDAVLLAFAVPDALFFIGAGAASAYALASRRAWWRPALYVHAGAAAYAALYCWALAWLTEGDGLIGALLMTPSLAAPWLILARAGAEGGPC